MWCNIQSYSQCCSPAYFLPMEYFANARDWMTLFTMHYPLVLPINHHSDTGTELIYSYPVIRSVLPSASDQIRVITWNYVADIAIHVIIRNCYSRLTLVRGKNHPYNAVSWSWFSMFLNWYHSRVITENIPLMALADRKSRPSRTKIKK